MTWALVGDTSLSPHVLEMVEEQLGGHLEFMLWKAVVQPPAPDGAAETVVDRARPVAKTQQLTDLGAILKPAVAFTRASIDEICR